MLPFPDDFYTAKDESSNTGRRIAFKRDAMPTNSSDVHIDPAPYARNDGFSPGQTIVLRVPGLDNPTALANTNAVPINHLGRYTDKNTPVVVIDAKTGKRWPIWVEIDSNASTPDDTALLIHPAKNFNAKHRYIVALRNLKDSSGKTIGAPEGFRYYRDRAALEEGGDQQAARPLRAGLHVTCARPGSTAPISTSPGTSRSAPTRTSPRGCSRSATTPSPSSATPTSPTAWSPAPLPPSTSTGVDLNPDSDLARRVTGTFTVPCYMTTVSGVPCGPGSVYNLDSNGKPKQNGTWTANFICIVPKSIVDRSRAHAGAAGGLRARPARRRRRGQLRRAAGPLPGAQDDALRHR